MDEKIRTKIAMLGLDSKIVERALQQGLYASVKELVEDIFPKMPEKILRLADSFTVLAANRSLQGQLLCKAWDYLISKRHALFSRDFLHHTRGKSPTDFLIYVNGPMRNGVVVGRNGATAEFCLQRNMNTWVMYNGADWIAGIKNVASASRCYEQWLIRIVEQGVRQCMSMPWFDLVLPVKIDTVKNESIRKLLVRTPYCLYSNEKNKLQTVENKEV